MEKLRVLYISNGHPDFRVGGAEVCSYELFDAMRQSQEYDPFLLALTMTDTHEVRSGTCFHPVGDDPRQVLWLQDRHEYFLSTSLDKSVYTVHLDQLLTTYRPHLVHIHHTVGLGVDLIRQIKNSLPDAPVVYTLHEFLPICFANGLMMRTQGNELCREATPDRCHECFPEIPRHLFFLRERFFKSQFRHVDLFLCPSRFLLGRYEEWGIPREKLRVQPNGRPIQEPAAGEEPPIKRFGFFGQISPHKGIVVLLKAMKKLKESGLEDVHLHLNGTNLEREGEAFRDEVTSLLAECPNVHFAGRYAPSELASRMRDVGWVVSPSVWWENAPLVIQEAFMHNRPVICSNIGGMAEHVAHGVDGLHFEVGDVDDLADTLRHAATSPDLWHKLVRGIGPVYSISQAVEDHGSIYRSLLGATA